MPALNRHKMKLSLLVITTASLLSCGVISWKEIYLSRQPRGNGYLGLQEKCGLADCSVQVIVRTGSDAVRLAHRRGCNVYFADAVWVGSRVGVFVDGGTCQQIKVAYDIALGQEVPFSIIEPRLAAAIAADYGVTPAELKTTGGDIFAWATYPSHASQKRSKEEFLRRYPH